MWVKSSKKVISGTAHIKNKRKSLSTRYNYQDENTFQYLWQGTYMWNTAYKLIMTRKWILKNKSSDLRNAQQWEYGTWRGHLQELDRTPSRGIGTPTHLKKLLTQNWSCIKNKCRDKDRAETKGMPTSDQPILRPIPCAEDCLVCSQWERMRLILQRLDASGWADI